MYAQLGAMPKAQAILEVVRTETAMDSAPQRSALHWFEGEVELAKGRATEALEKIQIADKESHSSVTQEALARAFRAVGEPARATEAYETFVGRLREDCLGYEALPRCVAGKYELATLYQADKQPEKARKQLDELLSLWQGADEDLPLLKRAKDVRKQVGD
jgi:tetratricopeptide (TPR) repeat protein